MAVRTQSLRFAANRAPSHHLSVIARTDLPIRAPYRFGGLAARDLSLCVPPSLITAWQRDRNTNRLSITYAFRPRLRPASPAVDQHGCGTLGHSVEQIRTALALLVPTFALLAPPGRLPPSLHRRPGRSPTTQTTVCIRGFGAELSPGGLSVPRHHRPVSYYALFQGWLLLSQPPGCLCTATALPTQFRLGDLSRRSGLFPSRRWNFAPTVSLPVRHHGIRRLVRVGKRQAPAPIRLRYLRGGSKSRGCT